MNEDAELTNDESMEQPTLTLEVPLDIHHANMVEHMEDEAPTLDIGDEVAANHIVEIEQTIHRLYQRGKYEQ